MINMRSLDGLDKNGFGVVVCWNRIKKEKEGRNCKQNL